MENELISIIVSAYNAENTIKKCVNSILAQSYALFELIIVDDGSTDNTATIIDEMKLQDSRIFVVHKENGGLTSARKKGYTLSKGEYICFIDSDDYIEKDYLKELHSLMKEGTDIVIGSYYIENHDSSIIKQFDATHIDAKDFANRLILPSIYYVKGEDKVQYPDFVWLRLYRKSVITEKCFVSERVCYTEDLFFQFFTLLNAAGVAVSDKPIYHYIITEQSLSQKYRKNKLQMLKNRYEMVKEYCVQNGIDITDNRYRGLQYVSMLGCVYNAKLSKNYLCFRDECKKIYKAFPDCWKCPKQGSFRFENAKHYFIYILMKMRLYRLLYFLVGVRVCG